MLNITGKKFDLFYLLEGSDDAPGLLQLLKEASFHIFSPSEGVIRVPRGDFPPVNWKKQLQLRESMRLCDCNNVFSRLELSI